MKSIIDKTYFIYDTNNFLPLYIFQVVWLIDVLLIVYCLTFLRIILLHTC